jgi:hypothetical protein
MNLPLETTELRPWLRALDPYFPMLATQAAVELDGLRLKNAGKTDAVQKLSELLKTSFNLGESNSSVQSSSLLEPSTVVLVGRALEAIPDNHVANVAEVQEKLSEVASWLDGVAMNDESPHLVVLRDFCLALARAASLHHRTFSDEMPEHSYYR